MLWHHKVPVKFSFIVWVSQFRATVDNHDNDGDGIFDIFFPSVGQSVSSNGWREYQEIVRRMVTTRLLVMIMAMMEVTTSDDNGDVDHNDD